MITKKISSPSPGLACCLIKTRNLVWFFYWRHTHTHTHGTPQTTFDAAATRAAHNIYSYVRGECVNMWILIESPRAYRSRYVWRFQLPNVSLSQRHRRDRCISMICAVRFLSYKCGRASRQRELQSQPKDKATKKHLYTPSRSPCKRFIRA